MTEEFVILMHAQPFQYDSNITHVAADAMRDGCRHIPNRLHAGVAKHAHDGRFVHRAFYRFTLDATRTHRAF